MFVWVLQVWIGSQQEEILKRKLRTGNPWKPTRDLQTKSKHNNLISILRRKELLNEEEGLSVNYQKAINSPTVNLGFPLPWCNQLSWETAEEHLALPTHKTCSNGNGTQREPKPHNSNN